MQEVYWSNGRTVDEHGCQTAKARVFASRKAARRFAHSKRMELRLPIPDIRDEGFMAVNRLIRIDAEGVEWDKYVYRWW